MQIILFVRIVRLMFLQGTTRQGSFLEFGLQSATGTPRRGGVGVYHIEFKNAIIRKNTYGIVTVLFLEGNPPQGLSEARRGKMVF